MAVNSKNKRSLGTKM